MEKENVECFLLERHEEVVYENGVVKPVGKVELKEGTKGVVLARGEGIADILEDYSRKVDRDVLNDFLEERR